MLQPNRSPTTRPRLHPSAFGRLITHQLLTTTKNRNTNIILDNIDRKTSLLWLLGHPSPVIRPHSHPSASARRNTHQFRTTTKFQQSLDHFNRKATFPLLLDNPSPITHHQKYSSHDPISATMPQKYLEVLDSKLKAQRHDSWGWVIYRCTYSSDSDWAQFMETLKTETHTMLNDYGATEAMADQLVWTVIEDREHLENATKSDVRRIFNEWVNGAEAAAKQPNASLRPPKTQMAQYKYCIHVDETSLRSALDDSEDWHLNIVDRTWIPEAERLDDGDSDDDDDFTKEELEEIRLGNTWPEIEGCTEEDVGWCKASQAVLVDLHVELCDENGWELYYERPPDMTS